MSHTSHRTSTLIATISRPGFWLKPLALARSLGFSPVELRRIQRLLKDNESTLLEKWHERFGD